MPTISALADDEFATRRNPVARAVVPPAVEDSMTADLQQIDLERQAEILETACRPLLLRPHDALAREHLARTIAAMTLATAADDGASLRGLVDEVRARADSLAFRLESGGYNGLYISAATAMLCQALAQLRVQLAALDGQAAAMRLPREFGSPM
jgi:hypothetical protein